MESTDSTMSFLNVDDFYRGGDPHYESAAAGKGLGLWDVQMVTLTFCSDSLKFVLLIFVIHLLSTKTCLSLAGN